LSVELDQFLGSNYLVTVHGAPNPAVAFLDTRAVLERLNSGHLHVRSPFESVLAVRSQVFGDTNRIRSSSHVSASRGARGHRCSATPADRLVRFGGNCQLAMAFGNYPGAPLGVLSPE
jgi:hypothetical protein